MANQTPSSHERLCQLENDITELKLEKITSQINADSDIPETVLDKLVGCIASDWQRFGRLLGLADHTIDMIELDESNSFESCRACITKYKQVHGGIHFSVLKEILCTMERVDVINELEKSFTEKVLNTNKILQQERLKAACLHLKSFYKERFGEILRSNGILDISKVKIDRCSSYVDLAVAPTDQVETTWKVHSDREFYMNQQCFDFVDSIKPEELFNGKEKFVCMNGVAGSGKSTLLLYLTMLWAKDEIWCANLKSGFQFVFTILCRELNRHKSCSNLEILLKVLYPFLFEHLSFADLQSCADQILIVVDGLDEYAHIKSMSTYELSDIEMDKCGGFFAALNTWDPALLGHYVVAAGRPEASKSTYSYFRNSIDTKCIQILGFNDQNIDLFIKKFFEKSDDDIYAAICEKIFQSANLLAMARLPVYLSTLCLLLEAESDANIETTSEVVAWALGLYIRHHYHSKKSALSTVPLNRLFAEEEVKTSLNHVFRIAYKMLNEGKVLFDADQLDFDIGDSLEYCGLISTVEDTEFSTVLQFTHLCLQEFCAAAYIFQEQLDYLVVKKNVLLRGCLPVLASFEGALTEDSCSHPIIKSFVKALDVKKNTKHKNNSKITVVSMLGLDVFDLETPLIEMDTTDSTVSLFLTSLHEFKNGLPTDLWCVLENRKFNVEINNYSQVHLDSVLYFLGLLFSKFTNPVKQLHFYGTLSKLPENYFVKFSYYFLDVEQVLVKQCTEFSYNSFSTLMTRLEEKIVKNETIELKCLHLNACGKLESKHFNHFSYVLPYIEEFDISYNPNITVEGFQYMAAALRNKQKTNNLSILNLACCNINEEIMIRLKDVFTNLTKLNLSYNNNISLCGWICFSNTVQLDHSKLQSLILVQCAITDEIMDALYPAFTKLKEINLSLNRNITSTGWRYFENALSENTVISTVDLYACNLTDESMEILSTTFMKLETLILCWNRKITRKGWMYMVEMMNSFPWSVNLKKLDVKGCNITAEDIVVLTELTSRLDEVQVSVNSQRWKDIFLLGSEVTSGIQEVNPWF